MNVNTEKYNQMQPEVKMQYKAKFVHIHPQVTFTRPSYKSLRIFNGSSSIFMLLTHYCILFMIKIDDYQE